MLFLSAVVIVVGIIDVAEVFESSVNVPDAHREVVGVGDELVVVPPEEAPAELDDAPAVPDELVDRRREVFGAPQHDGVLVLYAVVLRQRHEAIAERRVPDLPYLHGRLDFPFHLGIRLALHVPELDALVGAGAHEPELSVRAEVEGVNDLMEVTVIPENMFMKEADWNLV